MNDRRLLALLLSLAAAPAAAAAPKAPARRAVARVAEAPRPPPASPDPAAAASTATPAAPVETFAYLRLPLLSERSAEVQIASVDEDPITLGQLNDALAATHESLAQETHATRRDVGPILDRLVTLRLFVAEARDMGLDEQPTFVKAVAEFKERRLRELAELRATKGVRPDPLEVERLYKDATREWKLRSLRFAKKEDADAFRAALAAGKPFAELAKDALAKKQATGNEGADWVGRKAMLPQVAEAVSRITKAPGYTDPVAVQGGFAIAAVEEVRYADDPQARATAEDASRERKRLDKLEKYRTELEKRYARKDEKLWKALDFEAAKPGFAALAKDRRAIVALKGGKPITVADVAEELQRYFFHGVDEPLKEKKLNEAKLPVLHKLLTRRLFLHDAQVAGIPTSPEFRKGVDEFEDSLLFGAYVEKVVVPDVKVSEDEGKAYYERHKAEFTLPAFYKLEGLAFSKASAADAAMKKLSAGTDFKFLRGNADGQVKADDRALPLDGQTFSANALPPELVQALANAKRDEVRPYAADKQFNLVRVVEVTPPKEQPYLEARAAIGNKLAAEKLNQAVKDVAQKLRKAHQVAVYLERIGN